MKTIQEVEEFEGACLGPIDVLVREIAEISSRLHALENKVFWITGN
jgi:hypothetical protein